MIAQVKHFVVLQSLAAFSGVPLGELLNMSAAEVRARKERRICQ